MEAAVDRLPNRNGQKVRHAHHAVHRVEHVDDDARPLSTGQVDYGRAGTTQSDIHRDIFVGMFTQDIRPAVLLLQGAVEPVRLCRGHTFIGG